MSQFWSDILAEVGRLLTKWSAAIYGLMLGMLGFISVNIDRWRTESKWAIIGQIGGALFIGTVVGVICYVTDRLKMAILLIPIATLLSDRFIKILLNPNPRMILREIIKGLYDYITFKKP